MVLKKGAQRSRRKTFLVQRWRLVFVGSLRCCCVFAGDGVGRVCTKYFLLADVDSPRVCLLQLLAR